MLEVSTEVDEALIVDVIVLVADLVMVTVVVEAATVIVLGPAVATLVLVVTFYRVKCWRADWVTTIYAPFYVIDCSRGWLNIVSARNHIV